MTTTADTKYSDPRAHALRARYRELFGGDDVPAPVEAIAEDLLGLLVEERELDGLSGFLLPAERRVVLNAGDSPVRRRFTLAHELGHWVCQCLEGSEQEVYCRAEEVTLDPEAAEIFGVSSLALQWRLYSFDLAERPA